MEAPDALWHQILAQATGSTPVDWAGLANVYGLQAIRELAADLTAPPEVLALLGTHPNPTLRQIVASNPQSPNPSLF